MASPYATLKIRGSKGETRAALDLFPAREFFFPAEFESLAA
jgi:hypothetical protein